MSSILKGLNEGRNYGRDSWDSNMPGYQGDYGGAKNFGRRNREWDEDDRIDARIRAEYEKKQEYERNGTFWLKLKDSQRHLPSGPFKGKQAANTAAIELLNQQPELKGNLVITAYGPDEGTAIKEDTPGEVKLHNVLWQAVTNESLREENLSEIDPGMITNIMSVFPMISKIIVSNAIGKAKKEASETSSMIATMKKYRDNQPVTPEEKEQMMSQFKDLITYGAMAVGSVMAGMPAGPGIALAGAYKKEIMELIKTKGPEVLISLLQTKGKLDVIKILYHKLLAKNALQYYHPAPQGVAESQLNELSPATLASYKKKAGADASAADKKGDYKRGDKRMSGIIKATKKEFDNDSKNVSEDDLDENCWKGYHKEGNKELFGKTVPNCVKNEDVAEEQHSCPHCGGEMVSEELMNEKKDACYYKVKSRYKVWPSAYASGALVKCRKSGADSWGNGGKKNESSILEGIERADENLHKWFKEKWVRFGPDGKIRGDCARGDDSEGKPKCLPQSKAQNLGKKGRASAAARKRREDPNPERSGKAINVNTKKKSNEDVAEGWKDLAIGGAMALGALGAGAQTMPNINAQQVELANKYYNVLVQRAKEDGTQLDTRTLNLLKAKAQDAAAQKMQKSSPQTQSSGFPSQGSERKVAKDAGQFESQGVAEKQLDEKWSQKYKDSINCSNPKGFSQRAHCQGKNK